MPELSARLRLIKEREKKAPGPTPRIPVVKGRNIKELPAYKALINARTVAPVIRYNDEPGEDELEREEFYND